MKTIINPNSPGAIKQGNREHPVDLNDHVFGPIITEVHWALGGTAVLEMIYVPGTSFVDFVDPSDVDMTFRYFAGDTFTTTDIKDEYAIKTNVSHDEGPWRAENEIVSWIADYRITIPSPNSADYNQSDKDRTVADGNARTGHNVNIDVIGGSPVFNLNTVTEPDGSRYNFYSGYTVKNPWWFFTDFSGNKDPFHEFDNIMYDYAALDNNGINDHSEVLVWYSVHVRPPVDYEKLRENWIINFLPGKTKTMRIAASSVICEYTLRVFKNSVKYVLNADGTVTVQNLDGTPAVPSFTGSGSQANGPLRYFSSSGFLPGT